VGHEAGEVVRRARDRDDAQSTWRFAREASCSVGPTGLTRCTRRGRGAGRVLELCPRQCLLPAAALRPGEGAVHGMRC